jgi:hypothetical protein
MKGGASVCLPSDKPDRASEPFCGSKNTARLAFTQSAYPAYSLLEVVFVDLMGSNFLKIPKNSSEKLSIFACILGN